MVKVGVITHWGALDNYGQTIQTYALQKALEKNGVESYLIRYTGNARKSSIWRKLLRIYNIRRMYAYFLRKKNDAKNKVINKDNHRDLRLFLEENITLAPFIYSRKDLLLNPPQADIFMTGSDQVWNKLDKTYFLDFTPWSAKRISYAASFGGVCYEGSELETLKFLLKPFDIITVRESEGLQICEKAGRPDAFLAPDPTLLLTAADYSSIAIQPQEKKPYILLYMLGSKNSYNIKECYTFASKHNLDVRYVASQRQFDDYPKIYPEMGEWLGLIQNARYVITNSFHGTVFSLIFNRQFITIPLDSDSRKMNNRVEDLLKPFDLLSRITNENNILLTSINYQEINDYLTSIKDQGYKILSKMITS